MRPNGMSNLDRRRFLIRAGTSAAVAGCLGLGGGYLLSRHYSSDETTSQQTQDDSAHPLFRRTAHAFEQTHELSETVYNLDGSWGRGYSGNDYDAYNDLPRIRDTRSKYSSPPGSKPLIRDTAERIVAYLTASECLGRHIYVQRAREGLEHLLAEQTREGNFPWYFSDSGFLSSDPGANYFESGIAGRALAIAYCKLKDERFRSASQRLAEWAQNQKIDPNVNYNALQIWHLAEHFTATGDKRAMQAAIRFADEGILPYQQDSGGWKGHNSWAWYHGITTLGLVLLTASLGQGSTDRVRFLQATEKALDYVRSLQAKPYGIYANPESDIIAGADTALIAAVEAFERLGLNTEDIIENLSLFLVEEVRFKGLYFYNVEHRIFYPWGSFRMDAMAKAMEYYRRS